ncbi:hypothetical protein RM780_22250 [Streptomyces sp. DSM 44917]|uniref:Uncharacterized protein n=1 Tax=Streptomyces boetiae TaxID=3075541 RepID=A0ABU2LEG9_9ACTN|nr:hypothetical protein [Streptomyces sp. DSM 44917]MDT0309658.1 hypothetical protein [Streptomyces sp. DSM 44917]
MNVAETLIPALAIVATTVTALGGWWHQRRIGEQARVWERRADLYVELLTHQHPYLATRGTDWWTFRYFGPETAEEYELLRTLSAHVDVFATEEVARLWREALDRIFDVSFYMSEEIVGEPSEEEKAELALINEARSRAVGALRERIRRELKTDTQGVLRPRSWN